MAGKKRRKQQSRRRGFPASRILLATGIAALAALALVVGVLAFSGGDDQPRRGKQEPIVTDAQQVDIDVVDDDYKPRDLTIKPGTRVTWKFEGKRPHTITAWDGAFDSGILNRGDEWSLTFEDPGQYDYLCTLHHAMQAKIVVAP